MSYELFLNGSTAEIIITILVSLIVTLAVYCAIPLLIASFRKKPITRRKYRHVCFAANIIPLLIFIVINGSSSGGPYLIWTTVFAGSGSKKLATRGLLIDGKGVKQQTTYQTAATKMSLSPANSEESALGKSHGNYHITGKDIRLEPASESQPIYSSPKNSPPVAPAPAPASSKQRFCKYCGGAIDSETKQCTSCGKQFFKAPKASSSKLIATIVVFALLFGAGGFFVSTYNKGMDAMHKQQFIMAKQYFDNLIVGESLFPDDYAYIEAGVLMETGKYVGALRAFNELEGVPVPAAIIDSLKEKIYFAGQTAYKAGNLEEAQINFSYIEGYKRSDDYLLLSKCKGYTGYSLAQKNYDKLLELLDFEDTSEIILNNSATLEKFLLGRWEDGSTSHYYFELKEDGDGTGYTSLYNLPYIDIDGYFYLNNGIYSLGKTKSTATNLFKFSIIDKDTISVFCYKDGSTHRLHCVKRYTEPSETAKVNPVIPDRDKLQAAVNTVYAVQDGSGIYHRSFCSGLVGSRTAFSLEQAKGLGFQPCPNCCG